MAVLKLTKSWVRSPNRRLMRGCEKHLSVETFDTHEEEGVRHTHLGGTRSCCSDKRKLIEDELCASGESEDNIKVISGFMK
jgi:hypothetical protein